jgi:hypothetical protein
MKKKKAILNLSKKGVPEVATKALTIHNKMKNNPDFPAPSPPLDDIKLQRDVMLSKQAEQQEAFKEYQKKTLEMNEEKEKLIELLEEEGSYVEIAADGDAAKIIGAGYDVKKVATPAGMLPAPTNVEAKEGANDGDIIVTWNPVKGKTSYEVFLSFDITDSTQWSHQATVTKTKCFIAGIDSGTRIWVRVCAINAAGQGAFSDPATKTAP